MDELRFICLLALAVCYPVEAWAGKLARVRAAVRHTNAEHKVQPADRESDEAAEDHDKGRRSRRPDHLQVRHRHGRPQRHHHGCLGVVRYHSPPPCYPLPAVATQVCQPTVGPAVGPMSYDHRFAAYPYAGNCHGCLLMSPLADGYAEGKTWSGQVQFELGSDLEGLDRRGVTFLLEGTHGWGLDFAWDSYHEEGSHGYQDALHMGQLHALYRIAESEQWLVRCGLGAAWLGDRRQTDGGVNFTLQADYLPRPPFVCSAEVDLGTLGKAETFHVRGTAGLMLNRCELFGGYDFRRIGDVEIAGPLLGLRIWY